MFFPISKPSITQLEIDYVTDAVKSTWISSLGPYIDRFESEFASFCEARYGVSVANGTVALHLSLVAQGVGPGDEVIMPNLSFVATANAVLHAGAIPVMIDIEPFTLCMDPEKIEAAITPRTKVIMPVHLYGHPADMPAILEMAGKHNLIVIEDAAEAHGARAYGRRVGSWGHCATFSFYGNKNMTTGEGGMITTSDEGLYQRLRYLRDHAMSKEKRYWHTEVGYNYRITNMQAALGCAQLERLASLMAKRQQLYTWYQEALQGVPGISLNRTQSWAENSYWLICLEVENFDEHQRDAFMLRLKQAGVDSRPYFYPMSQMPYLQDRSVDTPVTNRMYQRGMNLPTYFDLTKADVDFIANAVKTHLHG